MIAIGLVGSSGSGKTALAELLVHALRERGLRVGYLKHAHAGFEQDVPGADSWRIREAGAAFTSVVGGGRFMLAGAGDDEPSELLLGAPHGDIVLLEGWSTGPWPKVVVSSPAIPQRDLSPPVLATIKSDPPGVFRDADLVALVDELAALVEPDDEPRAALMVDGRVIDLRDFPASILASTVLGMIAALDGVVAPREVTLRIGSAGRANTRIGSAAGSLDVREGGRDERVHA